MPDLGDYITRLVMDASRHKAGADMAILANKELSGSCNVIIGALQRQEKQLQTLGFTTRDWIAADSKASSEVKEHTLNILQRVEAMKKLANAVNDPVLRMMNTQGDPFSRGLRQMGVNAGNDAAAAARDANDPILRGFKNADTDPFSRGLRQMGVNNASNEKDQSARLTAGKGGDRWREEDAAWKAELERRRKANLDRDNLGRAENESERKRLNDLRDTSRQTAQFRRDDANVQKQLEDQGFFKRGKGRDSATAKDNRKWAGVEGMRAIEDFAQGSATGGLRGGLLAASNNISQMGAAFGAVGAMAGSLVSTVIVLGSSMYESWRKGQTGADEALAALREYDRMTTSVLEHQQQLRQFNVDAKKLGNEPGFSGAANSQQGIKDDIARRELDLKERVKARADQMGGMGAQGMSSMDLDNEASRRQEVMWGLRRDAASAQAANLSEEALTIENRNKVREQEREDLRGNRELVEQKRLLQINEQRMQQLGQEQAQRSEERRRAHERGGRGPLTDWQQMDEERGRANAQNEKDMNKFGRGQKWFQSRSEETMLSGFANTKDRDYYAAEKEHEKSLRQSEEAEKRGIITAKERQALDKASESKRDKDMRQTKYGDLQADGNSGFGSADARSTSGMNAIVKAMRFSEQSKTIDELKRNGDITKEVVEAVKNVGTILSTAPTGVVDF